MEEDKIQKLHDNLSKLRKGKGLGTSSHYDFGGPASATKNANGVPMKKDKDGNLSRDDGLPMNSLYSNFVTSGSYVKTSSALKYGDGRAIKRNFDDCATGSSNDDESDNSTKATKRRKKEEKKALKKAEKLEAKKKVNYCCLFVFFYYI